jgi:hypothetical protein
MPRNDDRELHALVAQRTERRVSTPGGAGSNPAEGSGELAERQGIAVLTRRDRKVGQVRLLHSPPFHAGIAQRQSRGLPNRRSRVRSPLPAPIQSIFRRSVQRFAAENAIK